MKTRSYQKELLDQEDIPETDLFQNLKELKFINTYLGGHNVILKGLNQLVSQDSKTVLEIGSGGGDNLIAIKKKHKSLQFYGLDLKESCINYAKNADSNINWILSDFYKYKPVQKFDIIFNSLFCHHFDDESLIKMLKWMHDNSTQGFCIGDLHRHPLAYWSIKMLTALFSKSYLVKNDAPLSVKRGFKRDEWETLLAKAGIQNYSIRWCWAFRHLIIVKK